MKLGENSPPFCIVSVGSGARWIARLACFAIKLDEFPWEKKRAHTNKEQLMTKSKVGVGREGRIFVLAPALLPHPLSSGRFCLSAFNMISF